MKSLLVQGIRDRILVSAQGVGVGTMQYQGSGMAPHEPLHPQRVLKDLVYPGGSKS